MGPRWSAIEFDCACSHRVVRRQAGTAPTLRGISGAHRNHGAMSGIQQAADMAATRPLVSFGPTTDMTAIDNQAPASAF
jgi:hypothetical protein